LLVISNISFRILFHYVSKNVALKLETTLRNKLISETNITLKFDKSNQILGNIFEEMAYTIL